MTIVWLFLLLEVVRVGRRLSLAATLLVDFSLQLNHTQLTPDRNLVESAQLLPLRPQPKLILDQRGACPLALAGPGAVA